MDVRLPYPSRRMPVLARNVVATSQPLAASAGVRMLLDGGNAVDAALATAIALTVVEPTSNGIGGDAFAIVWDGQRLHGLNASGRSPGGLTAERFAGMDAVPAQGEDSLTTPGAVSAWTELHARFGRLPFESLFAPAVQYARDGFPVSPLTARAWKRAESLYGHRPDFRSAFLPKGKAPAAGDTWRFTDQAGTLERIAATRGRDFYQGALATQIASHVRSGGGLLGEEDLFAHQVEWMGTLSTSWQGTELHEIPPNGQGLAALVALGILRHTDASDMDVDSVASLHLQIEAMKLGFADAYRYVADPHHLDVRPATLLDDGYLAERAALIDPARAQDPGFGVPPRSGTVYLATGDADGMMVSFIQSNYQGFGSGVVVPGTGIALQNRGAGFTLAEGHPNRVGPAKRPFHTIIPGFLMAGGEPLMSFGVMGGPMQPQGHLQMVLRTVTAGQNPQAASDAPRWRVVQGLEVAVEDTLPADTAAGLEALGHRLTPSAPEASFGFGGAQLVQRLPRGGYVAGSDGRKDGQAVGF
ncbi:MAG: gamma-glutamyltransferase family protein [Trueperaceae bacterium]|nr:gamma-glutamyltransferase family protein [Trueperaceae bacterium]